MNKSFALVNKLNSCSILLFTFSLVNIDVSAQDISPHLQLTFPFKVLAAENGWKNSKIPIDVGEPLRTKDSIELKNGFIVLSHFSGKLFQFQGDTIFHLSNLQKIIAQSSPKHGEAYSSFLLGTVRVKYKFRASDWSDKLYGSPLEVLYPSSPKLAIGTNESLCIWIRGDQSELDKKSYLLEIKNIFDELKYEHVLSDSMFLIPPPEEDTGLLILELSDKQRPESDNLLIGIEIKSNLRYASTNPCTASTSIDYLQVAIELELNRQAKEALTFYEKAKNSSPQPFYQQVYEIAQERLSTANSGY